jgi:hypothetical protein
MYTSFREYPFRVPLHRIPVEPTAGDHASRPAFQERSAYMEARLRPGRGTPPPRAPRGNDRVPSADAVLEAPDYLVMREQLVDYERGGDEHTYDTVRLEGEKLAPAPGGAGDDAPAATVHVYEMYWADLTRLGTGAVRVFGELYQLLLNLAHLGRQTLDFAAARHRDVPGWRWYAAVHLWAVRMLTLPVPLLNLVMAALVLAYLPLALPAQAQRWVGVIAVGAATAVLVGLRAPITRGPGRVGLWLVVPVALGAAAGGTVWRLIDLPRIGAHHVILAEWMALAWAGLRVVLKAYDRRRPGAFRVGRWLYGATVVVLAGYLVAALAEPGKDKGSAATLIAIAQTFELLWLAIAVLWLGVVVPALLTRPLRLVVWVQTWFGKAARGLEPDARRREWVRVRRATRIAAVTLALPATLLMLLTLTLWSGLNAAAGSAIPECGLRMPVLPWLHEHFREVQRAQDDDRRQRADSLVGKSSADSALFRRDHPEPGCDVWENDRAEAKAYLREMIGLSGTSGFVPMLACAGAALLIALWALGPVVWSEIRPPRIDTDGGASAGRGEESRAKAVREGKHARWLGEWLTNGFRAMPLAGWLLFYGIFGVLPFGAFLGLRAPVEPASWAYTLGFRADWTRTILLTAGGWIAASAVGVLALRGRLDVLALGFRPAIDVALDVESYLRDHPRTHTPRARIVERYVSLLRYLCQWKDAGGHRYDAIVVVAHSQGAVITADLLGYFQREMDPVSGAIERDDPLRRLGRADPTKRVPEEIPLYLFTMGAPLRQLYSAAFPHQYEWVEGRERPELDLRSRVTSESLGATLPRLSASAAAGAAHLTATDEQIPDGAAPDPWAIRLLRWVNAYRSGDYVGRSLWRKIDRTGESRYLYRRSCIGIDRADPAEAGQMSYYLVATEDTRRSRRELCIGGGAHTHYWDTTAHDIAIELDMLIQDAMSGPRATPVPPVQDATMQHGPS